MEEFDSHTEHAGEQAHEAAQEARERWVLGVALTAAILAALAAIASMISGHHEHDAIMLQMQAADRWNQYQAKKLKTLLREDRLENLQLAGEKAPPELLNKIVAARVEQEKIAAVARSLEANAHFHDDLHMLFAVSVTLFQVAIAVSAISALTRQRPFWFVGIAMGAMALGFLTAGILFGSGAVGRRPPEPPEETASSARFTSLHYPIARLGVV